MKALRDNLALILVALIAIVLVFLMVRLQSLIMTTAEPTPVSPNTPEVIQPQQPAVVIQPTAVVAPTNTPEPTAPPAPPTATTGGYTVYGELEIGFDVLDKIAATKTNQSDRPDTNIRMRMFVLSEPKKSK